MCTAITFKTKQNLLFGRNLDYDVSIHSEVVITPSNFLCDLKMEKSFKTKYPLIGMANVVNNYPLYFDCMNTEGLCFAGLNFPHQTVYPTKPIKNATNLAPYELPLYICGQFTKVEDVKKALKKIKIIDVPFMKEIQNTTLHWIISDKSGKSIVIECTKDGQKVYDNPFGVLANAPGFDFHYLNVYNYKYLSNKVGVNNLKYSLKNLSEGFGAFGLPGDYSSPSRFIRALFNKTFAYVYDSDLDNVNQFFKLLESVRSIEGTTTSAHDHREITIYSSCLDTKNLIYYYSTNTNPHIYGVKLLKEHLQGKSLSRYKLVQGFSPILQN